MQQVEVLQNKLDEIRAKFSEKAPEEMKEAFQQGVNELIESGLVDDALSVGDQAKGFTLSNAVGEEVSLSDYLNEGPVVLTWYRGGWCPYCNMTLKTLQEVLPDIKNKGANLLALTPEVPDKSLSTKEKHDLEFEVLTDAHNKIAKEYGLAFQVPEYVNKFYRQNFDMAEFNDDGNYELPLAATYVIDTDGTITYAFVDADYRKRAEPETILEELNKLN